MKLFEYFERKSLAIAFAEIVLIMFGVLAALGLQSWWDDRGERKNLLGYLITLEEELLESRRDIESKLDLSVGVLNGADEIFTILADSSRDALPETFAEDIGEVYKIHTPVLTTGAYEQIVNSGSLRLIRNRDLSVGIAQYVQTVSQVRVVNQALWDTYYEVQVPFLSKYFVISDFGWADAEETGRAGGLLTPAPHGPYSIDLAAIRTQEYWNLLFSWKEAYADQVRMLVLAREQCDEILKLLRPEIEQLQK